MNEDDMLTPYSQPRRCVLLGALACCRQLVCERGQAAQQDRGIAVRFGGVQ